MTIDDIIAEIDAMDGHEPDGQHGRADDLVMTALGIAGHGAVTDAYNRLVDRSDWWATA